MSNTIRKPRIVTRTEQAAIQTSLAQASENGTEREEAMAQAEALISATPNDKQADQISNWLNWLADQLDWDEIDGEYHDDSDENGNPIPLDEDDASDESDDDLASGSKIERAMKKYRHGYVPTLSRSGKKSLCNGDELAMAMAGLSHHAIAHAADYLYANIDKWDKIPHATKYGHLNNGQIRMNSGNRIRGAIKRGDATIEQAIEAIQYAAGCYQDAEAN